MEPSPTATFVVDAAELGQTLGRLRKLGGRTPGPAIWRIGGEEIEVEWKGGAETLAGRGQGRASFRVDARYIEALAKTLKPSGALDVVVHADGRVRFGSFTVPCVAVSEGETHLLPVGASDRDVLLLAFAHEPAKLANAGLDRSVEEAREKLGAAIERAAQSLAWVGVERAHLERWLDAHLRAVADGEDSFEIARPTRGRQLSLFD